MAAHKQLYYLTNHELTAYSWRTRTLTRGGQYENEAAGWQRFAELLELTPQPPSYLLVDVIEEDFQRDVLPHVRGKAHQALLERRLSQLYRDTPFRHAQAQGRDKEGRKDDRFLFNALTNPDLPRPWLAAMQKAMVPLAGMYSLASLSQQLFDRLQLGTGPVLLVSHQSSGLRQSYFHEGYLRFSRLTPLFDHASERLIEAFNIETAKTRQFLASTRLLARGEPLKVVVLANPDNLAALAGIVSDNPDVAYQMLSTAQVQQQCKLGQFDTATDCDPLYLALLAGKPLATHFPLRDLRHFHQLLRMRAGLYGASALLALAATGWMLADVLTVIALRRDAVQLEQETRGTEQRYSSIVKNMPVTVVPPHSMKAVVDLEGMLRKNVPLPTVQIAALSAALEGSPHIALTDLHWEALTPASLAAEAATDPPPQVAGEVAPDPALLGIPARTGQVVLLEGEVRPFNDDYRAAIDSVNQFAAALNRQSGLHAEVTRQPIDLRPTETLDSSAGSTNVELHARFTMKLVWKP